MTIMAPYRRTMASAKPLMQFDGTNRWTSEDTRRARFEASMEGIRTQRRREASDAIAYANARLRARRRPKKGFDLIAQRICQALGVTMDELMVKRSRQADIILARHAIVYWAQRRLGISLRQIGMNLGRKHSDIIHCADDYVRARARKNRHLRPIR